MKHPLDKPIAFLEAATEELDKILAGVNSGIYQVDPDLVPIAAEARGALQALEAIRRAPAPAPHFCAHPTCTKQASN